MTFEDALRAIADQLDINPDELIAYAEEDTILGSDQMGDPTGIKGADLIPYTNDGKLLYALIRALGARRVLESGLSRGGSTEHIAQALHMNGGDKVISVDIDPQAIYKHNLGLFPYIEIVHADIRQWTNETDETNFDFIHEDASHEQDTVEAIYRALPQLAPNGCVIVSHDTAFHVGEWIRNGQNAAGFFSIPEYIYEGSPCGFSVMRYEGIHASA